MNYKIKYECVAMLLAGGQGSRLYNLTDKIAKPALSFGGKYKIIDFTLSNCVNSGIDVVGVLTQYRPQVLNEYIGNGEPWKLDGRVVMLPPYQGKDGADWYRGTANAIYQNIEFIDKYAPEYVLILSGDHIYRMDYAKMLRFHKSSGADATVATVKVSMDEASRFGILTSDGSGRIVDFSEKPQTPKSDNASMGIYIFNTDILKKYLEEDEKNEDSSNDFGKDIIPAMLSNGEKLYSYNFSGYWKDVGTLDSLLEAHTDLLGDEPKFDLFYDSEPIYTRDGVLPPHYIGKKAQVTNSIISSGCKIEGKIRNSVAFCGAETEEDTSVDNSVILDNAKVGAGMKAESKIIEKRCESERGVCSVSRHTRKDVCGIIFSNLHDKNIPELTADRTMAAIPFAARYRLVDFPISAMRYSGIKNIKIIAHHNYNSLMEHIGSGKDFGLSLDFGEIKILPPYIKSRMNLENGLYGSRLEALLGIKDMIENTKEKYIVLSDCDVVGKIDLNYIIDFHIKSGADITLAVRDSENEEIARDSVFIKTDDVGRVIDIINGRCADHTNCYENLNLWVASTDYLKAVLRDAFSHGYRSFTGDVLRKNMSHDKFLTYRYDAYIMKINSFKEYYNAHMRLISNKDLREALFEKDGYKILSKSAHIPPTEYFEGSKAINTIAAEGCRIYGEVEDSVIFSNVYIGKNAKVKNSVLLPWTVIEENARVNCIVSGKNVRVEKGTDLLGCAELPFFVKND